MAAYTTAERIAAQLGATFTTEQDVRADDVALAVTAWIDQRTGRSWQASGAITAELHSIYGDHVYLNHPPVSAVSAVSVHPGTAGGAWTALAASDYQLFGEDSGLVLLPVGYTGQFALVDYTSGAAGAPDDIQLAADVLAAGLMQTTLNPESAGAESVSVGQNDISVTYAGAAGQQSADVVAAIETIDAYRLVVLA